MKINIRSFQDFSDNIDFIKNYIDQNESLLKNDSGDEQLITLIKDNYRVTDDEIKDICKILENRKKESQTPKRDIDKIIKNLEAYCQIVGVKMLTRNDDGENVLNIERLKTKLSVRKSNVKKQMKAEDNKN